MPNHPMRVHVRFRVRGDQSQRGGFYHKTLFFGDFLQITTMSQPARTFNSLVKGFLLRTDSDLSRAVEAGVSSRKNGKEVRWGYVGFEPEVTASSTPKNARLHHSSANITSEDIGLCSRSQ